VYQTVLLTILQTVSQNRWVHQIHSVYQTVLLTILQTVAQNRWVHQMVRKTEIPMACVSPTHWGIDLPEQMVYPKVSPLVTV
jgi:hypothetical protein